MQIEPNCYIRGCKHFVGVAGEEGAQILVCAAFPNGAGIPEVIAYGDEPHLDPYPGDHGVQYEAG